MGSLIRWRQMLAALATAFVATTGAALPAGSAHAQLIPDDDSRTLSPYFVVEGAEGAASLPLKSTRADVTISGVIADVVVTQVYRNEGTTPIEARYVFPASTRAAVYALRLRVGDRAVDAQIREKQQARAEFAQARREGRSAALLEQQRPNVFTMAIANVMPGDEIAVDLRYTETIVPTDDNYRFIFPTVVGPRYNGAAERGEAGGSGAFESREGQSKKNDSRWNESRQSESRQSESHKREAWIAQPFTRQGVEAKHSFALQVRIVSPLPIASASSPTHPLGIAGVGTHEARLTLAPSAAHANRDVVIDYRLAGEAIGAGLLVQRGKGPDDENFFLLMAQPPARVAASDVVPREYVFIVDVSGSMHGFPLDTTRALLRDLVGRLRPADTFNIIPFAGGQSLLHPQSLPATEENIARAIRFINGQNGGGSTELLPALRRALSMPADLGRARSFVVITDGFVTIEKEAFDLVRGRLGDANLFAFGIGSSVNRHLIEGLARAGKGEPFFVLRPEAAAEQAQRFRQYIEQPVLTRVRVTFGGEPGGFEAYDLDSPHVPDLFARRPIVMMGKFRGELSGTIEIEGRSAGGVVRLPIDVAQAVQAGGGGETQGLKYLWACSRIAELGDYTLVGRSDDAAKQITALGLRYNLLTDYTSFIAVDKLVRNPGGVSQAVNQPSPLPEGVSELAVGEAPATPEPEFALLAALAGGLTWWMRRRGARSRRAEGGNAEGAEAGRE